MLDQFGVDVPGAARWSGEMGVTGRGVGDD
jgi:hypothetical protein